MDVPAATPLHQRIALESAYQLASFLRTHPIGEVFTEVDVRLPSRPRGKDVVYRPDVLFVRPGRVSPDYKRLTGLPDVVVEVISREGFRYDRETKGSDHERNGIAEYWLIDPFRRTLSFFRLKGKRYAEVAPVRNRFRSRAIPDFALNLSRIRELFV